MTNVVLGLGSNLGDRMANLRSAMALIEERGVKTVRDRKSTRLNSSHG